MTSSTSKTSPNIIISPIMATPRSFPSPQGGSALPLTFLPSPTRPTLIIGTNKLAASRAYALLDADARVIIASENEDPSSWCEEVRWRVKEHEVEFLPIPISVGDEAAKVEAWKSLLNQIDGLLLVAVTDTLLSSPFTSRRVSSSSTAIFTACRALNLPINTTDHPNLCTYTFPATHRFPSSSGRLSNLQVAVSTNGRGCRLAGRIKRDIVARLPRGVGAAVDNIGTLRGRVRRSESAESGGQGRRSSSCRARRESVIRLGGLGMEEDDQTDSGPLNSPVAQLLSPPPSISRVTSTYFAPSPIPASTPILPQEEEHITRMRWISQISEYWSIEYLSRMGEGEMERALGMWDSVSADSKSSDAGGFNPSSLGPGGPGGPTAPSNGVNSYGGSEPTPFLPTTARHGLDLSLPPAPPVVQKGKILLLGSGPGHPSLLTIAAHTALRTSTLILSDKLVPSEILSLIPSTTPLHIAKKFPGNAEGAQNEMMDLALEGAKRGEVVVRLKQGDPFVYGRGGEEVLFFRKHGFEPIVVPGVSSALAGPLMMGIPVTQRGVAESMVLCTGVGRKGKAVQLPGYQRGRSLVVLMGVARIKQVLDVLTREQADVEGAGSRDGKKYPSHLPIAIIERASSHDQRMVASTLAGIEDALERAGEQRPPGMMIIGWAALALEGEGEVTVLDEDEDEDQEGVEGRDKARVEKWLGGKGYLLKDGLGEQWDALIPQDMKVQMGMSRGEAVIDNYQEYNRG